MYLRSLAHAVPSAAFTQPECWKILQASPHAPALSGRAEALLRKVLTGGSSGIEKRHFACAQFDELFSMDAESLNRAFEREAPLLATSALRQALDNARLRPADLDALLVCTCTGYLCPGVTSHVAEKLCMRPDTFLQDLVGLGCGAAIPTLRAARGILADSPSARVGIVAVEICSAAFYLDEDPGVLISACLFGDGASAAICSADATAPAIGNEAQTLAHPLLVNDFDTLHLPQERELLRFENAGGKLRNHLHKTVPEKAAEAVGTLYERLPQAQQPATVIAHSGGRDVIEALENRLPAYAPLRSTRETLRAHGNLSSPSVLFALEHHLMHAPSDTRHDLWLTAFGAGFAAHSCRMLSP